LSSSPSRVRTIKFCEGYPEGKHMLEKVAKSESTKYLYSKGCKIFTEFLKKNPTQIVNEYKKDLKQDMYNGFDKWEQILDNFVIHIEKLGYKRGSIPTIHQGAKALINANVPHSLRLQPKTPKANSRSIPPVTIENLKVIYNLCNPMQKAIISVLKDSGMSKAEVMRLNVGDLEGFDEGKSWIHINVFRKKEYVEYETFLGPNAVEALRVYFALRQRKRRKVIPESPLFTRSCKPYRRLSKDGLNSVFTTLRKETGIKISSHRLRKFFETYMALGKVHPIILKYWMGHKIRISNNIEARYIIPPTPEQLKLYPTNQPTWTTTDDG